MEKKDIILLVHCKLNALCRAHKVEGNLGSYGSVRQDTVLNLLLWNVHEQVLLSQRRLPTFPQEPCCHAPCDN
jgi:hypothetical protein